MPTNAFGQQVYDPNATGGPFGQGGLPAPQQGPGFSQIDPLDRYNGTSIMPSASQWGGAQGGFDPYGNGGQNYLNWARQFDRPQSQGNGEQVRSSVAPLSQGPTQNTNAQQMSGSQSAPQDRYGSAYESNPNVTWSYGGQTTVNPLDRGQFLTQGAAQNLAGQLGSGYTNNAWQLGGPAAYSAPMQTINNLHNAGLVQQMLDRGMPIDQVRSQLDQEAAMARGGTQTTLNNPSQAQSESERMYQSMGLVRGADGQWRTLQNAQQTGAANGAPQASPSQQQRYGPLVSAMQQQRVGQGSRPQDGPPGESFQQFLARTGGGPQSMSDPGERRGGYGLGTDQPLINPETGMSLRDQFAQEQADPRQQQRTQLFQEIANNPNIDRSRSGDPNYLRSVAPDLYARLQENNNSFGPGQSDARNQGGGGWTPNPAYGMAGTMDSASSAMRNQPYLPNGGQTPFRNAMFGQRLGQYGQGGGSQYGQRRYATGFDGLNTQYSDGSSTQAARMGGPGQQFPSMQQVRGGQANNLGYDPYYYGPQARGPQAQQAGWQYPQNTGAFQLYNHGSQESNDLSAFNQRMQQQEQASMPAAWRTAQSAGRGGGGSWDWNQGANMYGVNQLH